MSAAFFISEGPMTPEDLRSPVWRRLTQELQERLQFLRELNDAFGNSIEKTALTRGQISEVKRLIALSQESAVEADSPFTGAVDSSHP
jgi:hypothetical protein